MDVQVDFWSMYSREQKRAYEVGRRVGFTHVRSLTYGRGIRDEAIEMAFRKGVEQEEAAKERGASIAVGEWNITIERMFSDLRKLEKMGRDLPGESGAHWRHLADRIRRTLADAYCESD